VFVLEVDGDHGGTSLLALCGDDWDWLATLRTMAGPNRYIFFSWPQGWRQNRVRQEISDGLRLIGAVLVAESKVLWRIKKQTLLRIRLRIVSALNPNR
jgi:hypothetical protein